MQSILVVDDHQDNRDLLQDIFEDDYDIAQAENGTACLKYCDENKPDLILLDVNMPDLDGFEVCRRLKANPETGLIPVVFVTALASAQDRIAGYEVGAEDYIIKPFNDEIIMEIVSKVLDRQSQMANFEKQNKEAMNTAFQAMASSAELGGIIQFLQASFTYKSSQALASGLLEALANFGLNSCVNIRTGYRDEYFGCEQGSMEAKVLMNFRDRDRLLDFGARTLVNGKNISVLVKNMPLDKQDLYGRIKDHLTVLISGSEACVKSLETEHQLEEERRSGIQSVVLRSHEELQRISGLIRQQEVATNNVIQSLNEKFEHIVFGLGLEEDQEQTILSALDAGTKEMRLLSEMMTQVESSFNSFVGELDQLVQ